MWKEMVEAFLKVQNWHLTGGTGENHKKGRTAQNTSQTRYSVRFLCVAVEGLPLYRRYKCYVGSVRIETCVLRSAVRGEVRTGIWWGRRPLGRPRRRWEDNIKMDLHEVGWGAWTGLIWLGIGTGGGLL
jgi:hypothetical protein